MFNLTTFPKITIVTPNYNLGSYLERTILSVLSQNYPNLEYIIIDGGSTDNSLSIIEKYRSKLSYFVSEKDNGLYHALNKGFARSTGEIMGWLNSDDLLQPGSLNKIASYFKENKYASWIQGHPSVYDETDRIVYERGPVSSYYFFLNKQYLVNGWFIQQESTFWKRDLWIKTGSNISEDYRLAGDFELWMRFFKYEKMYCINEKLAGFRERKGQMSADYDLYLQEANLIVDEHTRYLPFKHKIKLYLYKFGKKVESVIRKLKYQT